MDENKIKLEEIELKLRDSVLDNLTAEEKIEFKNSIKQLEGEKNIRILLDKIYNAQSFTSQDNKTFAYFIVGYKMASSLKEGEKLTKGGKRIIDESGANINLYSNDEISLLLRLYENNKSLVDKIIEDNKDEFTKVSFSDKLKEFLFPY